MIFTLELWQVPEFLQQPPRPPAAHRMRAPPPQHWLHDILDLQGANMRLLQAEMRWAAAVAAQQNAAVALNAAIHRDNAWPADHNRSGL